MRYGSDHNLIASQYQTQGAGGLTTSNYGGNNVKITTSRITANDGMSGVSGATGTRLEGSYTREVPTTTRKYQFHEKKYENGR